MDGDRFDALTRALGAGRSRRTILRGIGAAALGAVGFARAGAVRAGIVVCPECQKLDSATNQCVADANQDGTSCNDGNACTEHDVCQSGSCVGQPISCDDGNACTVDSCDFFVGCVHTPVVCDDSNACTIDSCDPTAGCIYTAINCDDGNPCTIDSCDPSGGCSHTAVGDGAPCNDGAGVCVNGACVDRCAGVVCAPLDQCHQTGTCDPATGVCSNPVKPNGAACDDGNACTTGDTCQAGSCVPGTPVICPAPDACHAAGACNPTTGVCSAPTRTAATCATGRIKGASCDCDGTCCGAGQNCVGTPGQRRCQ